jgi:hypothetical protein
LVENFGGVEHGSHICNLARIQHGDVIVKCVLTYEQLTHTGNARCAPITNGISVRCTYSAWWVGSTALTDV